MIARRCFVTTELRRRTMAEQLLQRDGFIWEVNRKLDESYTCRRGEDQERIPIKSVCFYIPPGGISPVDLRGGALQEEGINPRAGKQGARV